MARDSDRPHPRPRMGPWSLPKEAKSPRGPSALFYLIDVIGHQTMGLSVDGMR